MTKAQNFDFTSDENTQISFSGGRTSALLLKMALDANGGKLPPNFVVLFANTGKERDETLDFIHEIEKRWAVAVVWLEYEKPLDKVKGRLVYEKEKFRIVNYDTASRDGRPFTEAIERYGLVPNAVSRFCTGRLKEDLFRAYVKKVKRWREWDTYLGIRADEPRRFKAEDSGRPGETIVLPLRWTKTTEKDVDDFWARQPFDLKLKKYEGNCDLCFLKSSWKRAAIMREHPEKADWWIEMEKKTNTTFRKGRKMENMKNNLLNQLEFFPDDDGLGMCRCTD